MEVYPRTTGGRIVETDAAKIKAIDIWTTNHSKWDKPMPKIGLKYLNDLLEYIEDMELQEKQHNIEVVTDRIRKQITKKLEKEMGMLERRADDQRIEEAIYRSIQELKIEFQASLYEEEHATDYLRVIPVKFILKSLFGRLIGKERK